MVSIFTGYEGVQPLQGHTRLVGNKTFHYGQTILATSLLADRLVSKQTVVAWHFLFFHEVILSPQKGKP